VSDTVAIPHYLLRQLEEHRMNARKRAAINDVIDAYAPGATAVRFTFGAEYNDEGGYTSTIDGVEFYGADGERYDITPRAALDVLVRLDVDIDEKLRDANGDTDLEYVNESIIELYEETMNDWEVINKIAEESLINAGDDDRTHYYSRNPTTTIIPDDTYLPRVSGDELERLKSILASS
jgi:hypothetical protein